MWLSEQLKALIEQLKLKAPKPRFRRPNSLPFFPTPEEAAMFKWDPNRIRLAWPMDGEDPRTRYAAIIGEIEALGVLVTDKDLGDMGLHFEWVLADMIACAHCSARMLTVIEAKEGKLRLNFYSDCRSFSGKGLFMDINRRATQETGQVVFALRNCPGVVQRKKELAKYR